MQKVKVLLLLLYKMRSSDGDCQSQRCCPGEHAQIVKKRSPVHIIIVPTMEIKQKPVKNLIRIQMKNRIKASGCHLILVFLCFAISGCREEKEVSAWLSSYYMNPSPEQVAEKLLIVDKSRILKKYPSSSLPFEGFLTQFLIDNPVELEKIAQIIPALSNFTKKTVFNAIWYSNVPHSLNILKAQGTYYNSRPPDIDDFTEVKAFDSLYAGFLDFQWGRFFASGNKKPIELIVRSLEFGEFTGSLERYKLTQSVLDKENGIKEATFNSAMWALKSNALQHTAVKEILFELAADSSLPSICLDYLNLLLDDVKVHIGRITLDSSFYFSEIQHFSSICNTYRPDFKEMEQYAYWVKRIKEDISCIEKAKTRHSWMNLALGELYRMGWNLSIDGFANKAMAALSDTHSSNVLYKCRQKLALGKFFLNIDSRFNRDGIKILNDVKINCEDSLPEVLWWISYGYLGQGNRDLAISYLNEYLTLVPNDSVSIQYLNVLKNDSVKIRVNP